MSGPRWFGSRVSPIYAHSRVIACKYFLLRSIAYERMELNEHVLVRVFLEPVTKEAVDACVADLKRASDELVKPSSEHMSSALTGVLVSEHGITPEATKRVTKSGFMRHFWFGLQGWCFLRLIAVDLSTGQTWANRRGKEVVRAYSPG